jgi:hypothetical protein
LIPKGAALFFLVGLVAAGILGIYLSQVASQIPTLVFESGSSLTIIPDKINYHLGEPIHIRIINSGTLPLTFSDSSYGLKITRLDGTIIYSPIAEQMISILEPKKEKSFVWNQTKTDGSKIYQGRYKLVSSTSLDAEHMLKKSVIINLLN